jgi:hypothetical protein
MNNQIKLRGHTLKHLKDAYILVLVFLSIGFTCLCLPSCTMSVNMMNSQGKAEDVVDTDQKTDADVSPTLSIPVK